MIRRIVSLFAALCVVSACTFAEAPVGTAPADHAALKPGKDIKGVSNFAKVSDGLYRGAQPTAEGFAELKKMGIKTVVNLRTSHDDTKLLKGTELAFVQIECDAALPKEENVVSVLKIINDPANQPVFIHCARGADRTGLMVAVYRMTRDHWTADEAEKEMHNFKFNPLLIFNPAYLKTVDTAALQKKVDAAKMPALQQAP